jgi:putative membrane protein
MRKFVYQFSACIAALLLAALLLPGVQTTDYGITVLAGAFLGAVYFVLRPVARILLGIFNLITLGLVGFLIDAALVYGVAMMFPGRFIVENFLWAMATAAIVDVIRSLAGKAAHKK